MPWTEKDKTLFRTINIFGKKHLEKQITESSKKFATLKKQPEFFIYFGKYNLQKNEFVWLNNMNNTSYNFVINGYMPLFESKVTLKKLFQPVVRFNEENMNVIPYLMEALNAKFSVVRIETRTNYIYALTVIDGLKETFKYEEFDSAMMFYRKHDELDRIYKERAKKTV
jgi:hypothetical protein